MQRLQNAEQIRNAYKAYCFGMSLKSVGLPEDLKGQLQTFIMLNSAHTAREIAEKMPWGVDFISDMRIKGRNWKSQFKNIQLYPNDRKKLAETNPDFFKNVVEKTQDEELLFVIGDLLKGNHSSYYHFERQLLHSPNFNKLRKFSALQKSGVQLTYPLLVKELRVSRKTALEIIQIVKNTKALTA